MVKIEMQPDYSCEPLWNLDTANFAYPEDLPLLTKTVERLKKWQNVYDHLLDLEEPFNIGFKTIENSQIFEQEGLSIAEQIQSELGDGYEIYYRNERVKIGMKV